MLHITINIEGELLPQEARRLSAAMLTLGGTAPVTQDTSVMTIKMDGSEIKRALDDALAEVRAETEHPSAALHEAVTMENDVDAARAMFGGERPLAPSPAVEPAAAPPSPNVPAAPPVTSVSTVAPPAPSALTGRAPIVDAEGYEWDERIHASSRARIKGDDTWKLKRGVQDHLVTQVRAEYAGRHGLTPPPAPPPPPTMPVTGVAPPPPAPAVIDFPTIVGRVQEAITTGKLTVQDLNNYLVTELQVSSIREIALDPAKIALLNKKFFSP